VCRDVCCFYVEIMEMRVYHNHISYSHSIRTVLLPLPLCISLAYFHQPPLVTPYTSEERLITWQSVCCCCHRHRLLLLLNFNVSNNNVQIKSKLLESSLRLTIFYGIYFERLCRRSSKLKLSFLVERLCVYVETQ
jgi:hypothetical protein